MAKASVDPAELRRFAADLNRFNVELEGLLNGLHARLRALEQSWRDQEHRKFAGEFEQTVKVLSGFLENSRRHVGFLAKKAALAEEYLKQRKPGQRRGSGSVPPSGRTARQRSEPQYEPVCPGRIGRRAEGM